MAVIAGTITGCTEVLANPSGFGLREDYLLTVDFGAHTASTDTATVTGVGAAIAASTRSGKTYTLRAGLNAAAGKDTNQQAVYTNALTVSTDALTFDLVNATGTSITTTASFGVVLIVSVDKA